MKQTFEILKNSIDKNRLFNNVKEVSSFHRIQATPGYRQAANYVCDKLIKEGIDAKVLSYEANNDKFYLNAKMFKEWDYKEAYIEVVEPNIKLADILGNPTSIVQRSYPYDFTDGRQMIYLDKGSDPDNYKDVDFTNKIIFIRGEFHAYLWAIKKGAVGFVTDFVREVPKVRDRYDLYDALNYTSFGWKHTEDEIPTFGFVLTPKMGDQLAKLFEGRSSLLVKGKVDTSLYNGHLEVVEATLPGKCDEEVLLTAHLCHPKCSCNDNASGVSVAMEAIRVIKELIDKQKLEPNYRTIKIVLIPEFTGTFAYLSNHDSSKMVGALNLDMVGARQNGFYGPITLSDLPYSTASYISALSALCLDYAAKETYNLANEYIPKTNHIMEDYTGGSDHVVYSDPTIGVPCCMLGQWPDLYYHTSKDTLDVIDPNVLAFSCTTASMFAYTLSNLNYDNVKEIQNKAHMLLANKLSKATTYEQVKHIEDFFINSVRSYEKVITLDQDFINNEINYIKAICNANISYNSFTKTNYPVTNTSVYKRLKKGPIHDINEIIAVHPEYKEAYLEYQKIQKEFKMSPFDDASSLILYYINGKNTIDDISLNILCDKKRDYRIIIEAYIKLLETMQFVEKIS